MKAIKNICCIGAGYVGGPKMTVIASQCPELTIKVAGIYNELIALLNHDNSDQLSLFEPGLAELVDQQRGKNLFFTTAVEHAIAVLTKRDEFKGYDYAGIFDQMLKPAFIFEGRRLLDKTALKQQGFNFIP